jgi:hypothetical protein
MDVAALKKEARAKGTSARRLLELAAMDVSLSRLVAKAKRTPTSVLEKLSRSSDTSTQAAVASHSNTPSTVLSYLGGHGKYTILKAVAKNPHTPDEVIEKLATHKHSAVREAVACREVLPEAIAVRLAKDPELAIRMMLIRENRTDAVWQILAKDSDPRVRGSVAKISTLSDNLLESFFGDPSQGVRASLGLNFKLASRPDFVDRLLNDADPVVRTTAYRHGKIQHYLRMSSDANVNVRAEAALSLNKNLLNHNDSDTLLKDLFTKFAKDPDPEVRMALTENDQCLADTLIQLATDPDERVRYGVTTNNQTPRVAFEILLKDKSKTRFSMFGEPSPKGQTLGQLAKEGLEALEEEV